MTQIPDTPASREARPAQMEPAVRRFSYRQLDDAEILWTLRRLRDRIVERFPQSSLGAVATDLLALGDEIVRVMGYIGRPHWALRAGATVTIVFMVLVLIAALASLDMSPGVDGFADLIQAMDAGINNLIFLSIAAFFLLTLEVRLKRRRALKTLHQLRSVAHIVDMHQLTKDPERLMSPQPDTASSPRRVLTPAELGRYLDYCSETLSVISKLAALHGQRFNDPVTLAAVNDIETLTTALSNKIWQKITLLERTRSIADGNK